MPPGNIILLNGPSSSGKTTLLEILQEKLETPYLNMGIDKFIWMMPKRYLDRPLWNDILGKATKAGQTGHILFSGMHHAIAAAAQRGNNILADHVLVEKAWVEECARLFHTLRAYLVGIRCPLEVLEQREWERKDRTLGQAVAQFEIVHRHTLYDLEVDTSQLSPEECANRIIARLQSPPEAFIRLFAQG
jgi:chloramphenicol 3-O phosphotransferase